MLPQAPPREDEKPPPGAQRVQEALFSNLGEGERKPPELDVDARFTVSDREVLQKDFAQMTAAEIAAAKDAIKRLVLSLDEVKTRRLAPDRHGHRVDMRRTCAQAEGRRASSISNIWGHAPSRRRSWPCSIFQAP